MPGPSLEDLVARGKAKASDLGHELEMITGDVQTAFYRCRRCEQTFTVGYPVYIGNRPLESRLELIAASVLSIRCSGHPPQATSEPTPPIPMISPDGNWEWNGAEWKRRSKS
jgi:hypothetical protein